MESNATDVLRNFVREYYSSGDVLRFFNSQSKYTYDGERASHSSQVQYGRGMLIPSNINTLENYIHHVDSNTYLVKVFGIDQTFGGPRGRNFVEVFVVTLDSCFMFTVPVIRNAIFTHD